MKYLCPDCERLVAPGSTRVEDDRIVLECPKCGAVERIELDGELEDAACAGDAVDSSLPSIDGETEVSDDEESTASPAVDRESSACPKCGAPRGAEDACAKCGLIFAKWTEDADSETPETVVQLWKNIQKHWDDEILHRDFLRACLEVEALSFAARCYRSRDDDVAKEQLRKLTNIGVQAMHAAEQPGRLNPKVFRIVGWALFFLLCAALLVAAFSVRAL
jgi:DNA-directed RNA polymerase subunit M/transcription elongation factor TFIIS